MKWFRISLAGLMASVVYLGFAIAAVSRPTQPWVEAWMTTIWAVLAVVTLKAIYSRPRAPRAFWGGFAIVGGGFMGLNTFPAHPPHLVTRGPIERFYRALSYDPESSEGCVWVLYGYDQEFHEARLEKSLPGDPKGRYRVSFNNPISPGQILGMLPSASLRPISLDDYQQLCHTILAPLLGLAGGLVARGLAARARSDSS